MSAINAREAVVRVDGVRYTFRRGALPEDTPGKVVKALDALGVLVADEAAAVVPAEGLPFDVEASSAADLAAYIESEGLTAPATVALADGQAALAAKVLEAENLGTGNDPRKTVAEPLQAIIDAGS